MEKNLKPTDTVATGMDGRVFTKELLEEKVGEKLSHELLMAVKTYDLLDLAETLEQENLVALISVENIAQTIKNYWLNAKTENHCIGGLSFYEDHDSLGHICKLTVVIAISSVVSPEYLLAHLDQLFKNNK